MNQYLEILLRTMKPFWSYALDGIGSGSTETTCPSVVDPSTFDAISYHRIYTNLTDTVLSFQMLILISQMELILFTLEMVHIHYTTITSVTGYIFKI